MERSDAKKIILKSLSKKVKPDILSKNIEGLVDEYLETQQFIIENGADPNELPTKEQIKWWFQDPIEKEVLQFIQKDGENIYEIKIDQIYLTSDKNSSKKDKFAEFIYKFLYKYEWETASELPSILKELVKLHYIAITTKNDFTKKTINKRLGDYALLGTVRLYGLERIPYLRITEMEKIIKHFRLVLDVIYKMMKGEYGEEQLTGSIFLFDGLERFKNSIIEEETEINNIKPEKKKRKRKPDNKNGS